MPSEVGRGKIKKLERGTNYYIFSAYETRNMVRIVVGQNLKNNIITIRIINNRI